jgi:glycosyltransferase involved in cell wall biosynthesis
VKVLIDARRLAHGGIGTYLQNLILGLFAVTQLSKSSSSDCERLGFNCSNLRLRLILIDDDFSKQFLIKHPLLESILEDTVTLKIKPGYSLTDHLFLGREIGRKVNWSQVDVFHAPHYNLQRGIKSRSVVTVHDLIHIHFPEAFYYPLLAKRFLKYALISANQIIAVSRATQLELESFGAKFGVTRPITVIPNAFDQSLEKLTQVDLEKPFFLAVFSNLKPHKNLKLLVSAYELLSLALGPRAPKLYLVGSGINKLAVEQLVKNKEIKVLGPVSSEILRALYSEAAALVVPSLAEGFCLPVLEAHSYGTPVVSTPVPAIKELAVLGDLISKDFSVTSFAEALIDMA